MNKLKELAKLLSLLRHRLLAMLLAIVFGTLGHVSALMIPFMTIVLLVGPYKKVYMIILIVSGVSRAMFRYAEQAMNHYIAFHVLADIRNQAFEKLRELAPAKLESKDQGDIISILTGDIELIEVFYAHTLSPIFIALLFNSFVFVLLFKINPSSAVIAIFAHLMIGLVLPIYFSHQSKNLGIDYRNKLGAINSKILESIGNMMSFRQYSAMDQRQSELSDMNKTVIKTQEKVKSRHALSVSISDVLIYGSTLAILYTTIDLDFRIMALSFILHISSFGPSLAVSNLSLDLNQTLGSIERLNCLLNEEPLLEDVVKDDWIDFHDLEFKNVSFCYDEQPILKDLDLQLKKGEIVGIMGESGSGKSTMAKLLMRYRKPDKGCIEISGRNLEEIDTRNLKELQAYMTQESHLFKGSIRDNITMFSECVDENRVIEAAKKASIHHFICSLENSYDSLISELASNVSSGEKQRLALARLFYFDRPIMILDEPSSNLDSLSEAMILKSLYENHQDKAIILISHRKSAMRIADKVYQMLDGKLIELQE